MKIVDMDAINKAVAETARLNPRGAKGMAVALGLQPGTFSNKCNANCEEHQVNIREVVAMMEATGDLRILRAIARSFDTVCLPIKPYVGYSDEALLDAWTDWEVERAETIKEIRSALSDGEMCRAQYDRIKREMFEDCEKELGLLQRVRSIVVGEAEKIHPI